MYEKPPLFWVRCSYCGHTIGLATEIRDLMNYYTRLIYDLERRMYSFENCSDWHGIIDSDLYNIQVERYKSKIKELETRILELQDELDKCNEFKKKLSSIYGISIYGINGKGDNHEN